MLRFIGMQYHQPSVTFPVDQEICQLSPADHITLLLCLSRSITLPSHGLRPSRTQIGACLQGKFAGLSDQALHALFTTA
ncbi:hypothetical protein COCSUDRAFT_33222 [Coccomyxa subellipsoidea C-169]|uniref:Uncharacterized protein n=1 Tax=Coccomyxa subellipsoidea (strain C-169) TaxID=574566 RepID=I0YXA1_COCSC|nr:hypothetical protein COCSUDRAFT_33222 [Coccomyxa subellipsoidea C-169]EIE23020.1 hypothetical protein COCSUDRAFT_33222 [Coccomyxa subellipsoidea C-169]|eukprot:XP_005647564.1 hypothetical protein COCSUDRAFT_33222 [Coccomyxa subellipsoidea C-169]